MTVVAALVLLLLLSTLFAIVALAQRDRLAGQLLRRQSARRSLIAFADQCLERQSLSEIFADAAECGGRVFGGDAWVFFEPLDGDAWLASNADGSPRGEVEVASRGLFSWFKHTPLIAHSDLGERRFGAMRGPLRALMDAYKIDVLLPLVDRDQVLAVVGMGMGRALSSLDRELLRLFRLETAVACANVRLHHHAAEMVSLAREVDLARSVELAMVPSELKGELGALSWSGYYDHPERASSDFFGVYALEGDRMMIVIGDAVGSGLAGSMVSAVIKSCCDTIFEQQPRELEPSQLLAFLNESLCRPDHPAQTSCFAALFDPGRSLVFYSKRRARAALSAPFRLLGRSARGLEGPRTSPRRLLRYGFLAPLAGHSPRMSSTCSPPMAFWPPAVAAAALSARGVCKKFSPAVGTRRPRGSARRLSKRSDRTAPVCPRSTTKRSLSSAAIPAEGGGAARPNGRLRSGRASCQAHAPEC